MDLLRVIACLMVVSVHTNVAWKHQEISLLTWKSAIGFDSFCRGSVLVFFMLSGAFGRSTDVKKALKKAFRYMVIFFLFSVFYSVSDGILDWSMGRGLSKELLINRIFEYKYHLWFMPAFAFLIAVSPFVNRLFNSEKGRVGIKIILVVWALGLLLRTAQIFTEGTPYLAAINSQALYGIAMILTESSLGCYCLGRFLVEKKRSKRENLLFFLVWIAASIAIWVLTVFYSKRAGVVDERWMDDVTVFIVLEAIGLFCFISGLDVRGKVADIAEMIAPYTFGIYLIHVFFIDWLRRVKVLGDSTVCGLKIFPVIQAPIRLAIVFAASLISVMLYAGLKDKLIKKK